MSNDSDLTARFELAKKLAHQAGATALDFFRKRKEIQIEHKGTQDFVTIADRAVEEEIRQGISTAFPDDGILGEEDGLQEGKTEVCWVIDPIDGTANFVSGILDWCVVITGCVKGMPEFAVIYNPNSNETFTARRGGGAFMNGERMQVSTSKELSLGSIGVGTSPRHHFRVPVVFIDLLMERKGVFYRNQSGALMLAFVADGRLIGYYEENMNSWDCLGGLLMIEEAGGQIHPINGKDALTGLTRAIAGPPAVYQAMLELADKALIQAEAPSPTHRT